MIVFKLILLVVLAVSSHSDKVLYEASLRISVIESNSNPNVIGDTKYSNYSVGLCQIRIKTAIDIINNRIDNKLIKKMFRFLLTKYSVESLLLNPIINRYLCITYLKWLYKRHKGDLKEAVISYNTGYNAKKSVRKKWGIIYYNRFKSVDLNKNGHKWWMQW